MDADIKAFCQALPAEVRKIVLAMRAVVHRTIPRAHESLLWGGLSYHRPDVGGRVKGAACQITVKRGRVRLDFIHGVRLSDPRGLLQGDRVSKRFVYIDTVSDAKRPDLSSLIKEAAALDPAEWANRRSAE